MVALDPELAILYPEGVNELHKLVILITHKLLKNFLAKRITDENIWLLKIGEEDNVNSFLCARDFDQVDDTTYIMEVSI